VKIEKNHVTKYVLTGLPHHDRIDIMIEGTPPFGHVIISGDWVSYAYTWGGIGESHPTVEDFLLSCGKDYLLSKFGMNELREKFSIDNRVLEPFVRKEIKRQRKEGDISKEEARELFDWMDNNRLSGAENYEAPREFWEKVFGPEWYEYHPKEVMTSWQRLIWLIEAVKEALPEIVKTNEEADKIK